MLGTLIVTGASRGIGASIARLAAAKGYAVCVNSNVSMDAAQRVAADIVAAGGKAIAVQADVGDESQVHQLFTEVDRALGPVTALVNNAGITGPAGLLESIDGATLARVWQVNLTGSFLCAQQAVRRMSPRHGGSGGAIVNLSSTAARMGGGGAMIHYAASKAAIDAFTRGLAAEVGPDHIRVNAVRPGLIATTIRAAFGGDAFDEQMIPHVPLRRIGTPEEVATAVLWLLSPDAAYVTGEIMEIAGGL